MRNAGRNVVCSSRGLTRWFYNLMGRFYDLLYHRLIRGYVESADILMTDLVRPGDRVLDVGCGTGLLSYLGLPHAREVVGVDLSIGMVQEAQKKKSPGQPVHFVNGDALNLPLKAEFDCCVSAFMLVMVPREMRWRIIREMGAMLKPGGRMAFLTSRPDLGDQWMSPEEWRLGLEEVGLTGVQIWEEGDVFLNVVAVKPLPVGQPEETLVLQSIPAIEGEAAAPLGEVAPVFAQ